LFSSWKLLSGRNGKRQATPFTRFEHSSMERAESVSENRISSPDCKGFGPIFGCALKCGGLSIRPVKRTTASPANKMCSKIAKYNHWVSAGFFAFDELACPHGCAYMYLVQGQPGYLRAGIDRPFSPAGVRAKAPYSGTLLCSCPRWLFSLSQRDLVAMHQLK